jgi:hypothetical protein
MKKPRPRTDFANYQDEADHLLDGLCWLQAKDFLRTAGLRRGEIADDLKELYRRGDLVIERDGLRVRLAPAAMVAHPCGIFELISFMRIAADLTVECAEGPPQ